MSGSPVRDTALIALLSLKAVFALGLLGVSIWINVLLIPGVIGLLVCYSISYLIALIFNILGIVGEVQKDSKLLQAYFWGDIAFLVLYLILTFVYNFTLGDVGYALAVIFSVTILLIYPALSSAGLTLGLRNYFHLKKFTAGGVPPNELEDKTSGQGVLSSCIVVSLFNLIICWFVYGDVGASLIVFIPGFIGLVGVIVGLIGFSTGTPTTRANLLLSYFIIQLLANLAIVGILSYGIIYVVANTPSAEVAILSLYPVLLMAYNYLAGATLTLAAKSRAEVILPNQYYPLEQEVEYN